MLGMRRAHCRNQPVQSYSLTRTSPLCVPTSCALLAFDEPSTTYTSKPLPNRAQTCAVPGSCHTMSYVVASPPPPPRSFIRNKHVILLVITYHAVISSTYVDRVLQTRDPCSPVTLLQETEAQVARKLCVPSDEEVHLHFLVQPSQHLPAEILHHAVVFILPTAKHNCN